MIEINGVRYITLKTYAEINSISPSRVSQLKARLPVVHFDDINQDLINFDEVELEKEVREAADSQFTSKESLSTYSLTQLGDYFKGFFVRTQRELAKAVKRYTESETVRLQLGQQLGEQQLALDQVVANGVKLQAELDSLALKHSQQVLDAEASHQAHQAAMAEAKQLLTDKQIEVQVLEYALETLKQLIPKGTVPAQGDEPVAAAAINTDASAPRSIQPTNPDDTTKQPISTGRKGNKTK